MEKDTIYLATEDGEKVYLFNEDIYDKKEIDGYIKYILNNGERGSDEDNYDREFIFKLLRYNIEEIGSDVYIEDDTILTEDYYKDGYKEYIDLYGEEDAPTIEEYIEETAEKLTDYLRREYKEQDIYSI